MWKGLNVLIGVSGNGRYLTRLINQSGVKRLEARIAKRERQRSGDREREREAKISGRCCVSSRDPQLPCPPASRPIQDTH